MQAQRGVADKDWMTQAMQSASSSQLRIRNVSGSLQKFCLTDSFLSYQTHIKFLCSSQTSEVTNAHQVRLRAQYCFFFPPENMPSAGSVGGFHAFYLSIDISTL